MLLLSINQYWLIIHYTNVIISIRYTNIIILMRYVNVIIFMEKYINTPNNNNIHIKVNIVILN